MSGKLRVGVVGAGWWAVANHMPILKSRSDVELVAVCRLGQAELRKVQTTFDIPYAMTGGGPGDATETLAMYIHKTTLDFLDFGYGSALAALMFVISMVATSGYLRYTRRSSGRSAED